VDERFHCSANPLATHDREHSAKAGADKAQPGAQAVEQDAEVTVMTGKGATEPVV